MKTETQIAEENIERTFNKSVKHYLNWNKDMCREHKATCQRFLEFLDGLLPDKYYTEARMFALEVQEKITDLKQAIKLYKDAGIK